MGEGEGVQQKKKTRRRGKKTQGERQRDIKTRRGTFVYKLLIRFILKDFLGSSSKAISSLPFKSFLDGP